MAGVLTESAVLVDCDDRRRTGQRWLSVEVVDIVTGNGGLSSNAAGGGGVLLKATPCLYVRGGLSGAEYITVWSRVVCSF